MTESQGGSPSEVELDEDSRRVAAAAVAAAAMVWWPAFTFGVYRVIFFEQRVALWAISTTTFFVLGLVGASGSGDHQRQLRPPRLLGRRAADVRRALIAKWSQPDLLVGRAGLEPATQGL